MAVQPLPSRSPQGQGLCLEKDLLHSRCSLSQSSLLEPKWRKTLPGALLR